jgi:hypothetical protein
VVGWGEDIEEVRRVLRNGADPNYTTPDRNSYDYHRPVLHVAAVRAYSLAVAKVRCLVTEGGCDVNSLVRVPYSDRNY